MTDYSQYGEQAFILKALGFELSATGTPLGTFRGDKPGVFLDIGAYHPTTFSNTRALVELGWSGVMVEPSPGPMHTLLKEYGNNPRITLVQACVSGGRNELVALSVTDDALSTTQESAYQQWREKGGYFGTVLVPRISLSELWRDGADFVNIDAEGESGTILLELHRCIGANPRAVVPRCICVEHDGIPESLAAYFRDLGYQPKDLGINLLLWR